VVPGDAEREPLPADGRAPTGVAYTLEADGDCLALDVVRRDEIVVEGDEPGDLRLCDLTPRGRAQGELVLACAERTLFVFGIADGGADDLVLEPRRGKAVTARRFELAEGDAFLVAAPLDALPARLREADTRFVADLPAPGDACEPIPDGTVPDLPSAPVRLP
jgi:hypothetical protein